MVMICIKIDWYLKLIYVTYVIDEITQMQVLKSAYEDSNFTLSK